jgi:Flp pilus assembly pilin Flp
MVLVPLRQTREGTPRMRAFGPSATRKPAFGSEVSPRFGFVSRLARDKSGVAAIEYALLASLIAIAIISGAENLGNTLGKAWDDVAAAVSSAISDSDGNGNGGNGNRGNGNGNGGNGGGNGNGNNGNGNGNGGSNDGDGGP